jgi:DNA-binding MarR family transcriptional regulator
MLREILATFAATPGALSQDELARRLGVDGAVLDGMLSELVRLGRLERLDDRAGAPCAACTVKGRCPYVLDVAGTYYALPGAAPRC